MAFFPLKTFGFFWVGIGSIPKVKIVCYRATQLVRRKDLLSLVKRLFEFVIQAIDAWLVDKGSLFPVALFILRAQVIEGLRYLLDSFIVDYLLVSGLKLLFQS